MSDTTGSRPTFSFPQMESEVLARWEQDDIFKKSLQLREDGAPYVFFDGPPFATGLPHHGNLLASVIKDIVPRYWTMKGRFVERRFGWDCHGLPIEHEIDKKLGMPAHEAVAKLGIGGYNQECRGIVERYVREWRSTITRLGRWVDFDDDYKTMDADFMESVWWVVRSLWDKGLVYKGQKVMPVSTALATPLSNFEASSNYQDVQDPSITVLFKLRDEESFVSAWTTTPWTLPSNLALCVGPDIKYVRVRDSDTGKRIYFAEARLEAYSRKHELVVEERVSADDLVGKTYEPMFPYFAHLAEKGAFRVLADSYVNTDDGTGIVHQAPAFGEDDFRIAQKYGIEDSICPVGMNGVFLEEVVDFAGLFVKDADPRIISWLKGRNVLFEQDVIQHSYPFCYRSQSPLIYRAVPSWFVRVSEIRDTLMASNEMIRWVPSHIQNGRMGNWLNNAIDWCISRNRVWGTPIPIWENDETGSCVCIGSREELENLTGSRPEDLHRENIDPLVFRLPGEAGTYQRIPEVLDCWFESGSMPYAQKHYPFENKEVFEAGFPADFIAEGLDQTRGWFYTLIALSSAMFGKPAFQNVIVNGMVLAADGKKMSKSVGNYTDPEILMDQHGADALRLYLINSGLVRGEEQRFVDSGVRDMARRALLPWYNAWLFLDLYGRIDGWTTDQYELQTATILDRWILSRLQTLKSSIAIEMERYRLDNVVPQLFNFIEDLTNWFIRLNRARYWREGLTRDKKSAYSALYSAVYDLTLAMAPCTPFLSEHIYRGLVGFSNASKMAQSVHLCDFPEPDQDLQDTRLEQAVARMQRIVLLGRKQRENERVQLRTPLSTLVVIHRDDSVLDDIRSLEEYVKGELNVKKVLYDSDEGKYVNWVAKPNFPVLGKRLGKRMKKFQQLIQELGSQELEKFQVDGSIELNNETFTLDEINVFREATKGSSVASDSLISIDLDFSLTKELLDEGIAREIVHRIQLTRKELDLNVTDRIKLSYDTTSRMDGIVEQFQQYIGGEILAVEVNKADCEDHRVVIDGDEFRFAIKRA
ncbi:MAG: isoleucine--tRNA ligase [Gammaproteobacteria bacterium]|nr:isoleucine--tRNA ligase [Gammaproteobacteria bacterium]